MSGERSTFHKRSQRAFAKYYMFFFNEYELKKQGASICLYLCSQNSSAKFRVLGFQIFTLLIVDFGGFDYTKGPKFGPFGWEAFVTFYCGFWRNCLSQGSEIRNLGLGKRNTI